MPNQFSVTPGNDYSQGLQGLNQSVMNFNQVLAQRREQNRIKSVLTGASEVYKNGTPEQIAEYAIQNPEVGKNMIPKVK